MRPADIHALARATILPILVLVTIGACGDSTAPGSVARITISPSSPSVVVGEVIDLAAVLLDARGNALAGRTVSWHSANPETAAVIGGHVTGVRVGTTVITASHGGTDAWVTLAVTPVPVASIVAEPSVIDLTLGDSVRLTITMFDRAGAPVTGRRPSVGFASVGIATFDDWGWLHAHGVGSTSGTISADDARAYILVRVRERPVVEIRPMQRRLLLEPGATGALQAVGYTDLGRAVPLPPNAFSSTNLAVVTTTAGYRAVAPGTAEIVATYDGVQARIPVTVVSPPPSEFDIAVRWVGEPHAAAAAALTKAVAHWRRVVIADLPAARLTLPDSACVDGAAALDEVVDDLLLWVRVQSLDGHGGALAAAGPCVIRNGSGLTVAGVVLLDEADVDALPLGTFMLERLILHEIGHVLGLGTLWREQTRLDGDVTVDPRFTGAHARLAAGDIGFPEDEARGVAVENSGGTGTAGGHWRETVFRQELMTGWIEMLVGAPLSSITIGSLADLGYVVNGAAAEQLVRPMPFGYSAAFLPRLSASMESAVSLRDEPRAARFSVDPDGTTRPIPP